MKILWVKAGGLVPPDLGGRIRSYRILRELAKRNSVTLYTFYAEQSPDPHPELEREFERVFARPLRLPSQHGFGELVNFLRTAGSSWPYSVSKYCRPELAREVAGLVEKESYDVIVCDFVFAAGVIPWKSSCPKVLFTHNVEAQIWKRHADVAKNPVWKLVSWGEYLKMRRYEEWCVRHSDHVLAVSDADRAAFARIVPSDKLTVIATGVDTDYFRPAATASSPNSLVFTGSMDWMPNEDAILYFGKEILPRLRSAVPDLKVTVVGRRPSEGLRAAAQETGITVTGRVEDIRPYVHEAAVYIVPLRIGGGTRLKIFEAMAMGKAIVSTTIGAEGLPVTAGHDIVLADSAEDFAAAVLKLLGNPDECRRLGGAARRLVESKYDWCGIAADFETVLRNAAGCAQQLTV